MTKVDITISCLFISQIRPSVLIWIRINFWIYDSLIRWSAQYKASTYTGWHNTKMKTFIHASSGIWTHGPSTGEVQDHMHLRLCGQWEWLEISGVSKHNQSNVSDMFSGYLMTMFQLHTSFDWLENLYNWKDCVSSSETPNAALQMMQKETATAYFMTLSQHLSGRTKERI